MTLKSVAEMSVGELLEANREIGNALDNPRYDISDGLTMRRGEFAVAVQIGRIRPVDRIILS